MPDFKGQSAVILAKNGQDVAQVLMPQLEKDIIPQKQGTFVFPEVQIAPTEEESEDELLSPPVLIQSMSLQTQEDVKKMELIQKTTESLTLTKE